jgi:Zn-dependent peptidase ImmA (M78 family)
MLALVMKKISIYQLKKVNVFGQVYQVEQTLLKDNLAGLCDHQNKKICVDKNKSMNHTNFNQVLLHELIHAVFFRIGLSQAVDCQAEEIIADSIATAIVENFDLSVAHPEIVKKAHTI